MLRLIALTLLTFGLAVPTVRAQSDKEPSADAPTRPLKICVVDLQKVFDAYDKKIEREKALNDELEVERKKLEALVKRANELRAKIKQLDPNTNYTRREAKRLFLLQREAAFQKRWVEVDLKERMTKVLARLYNEILVGVARFSDKHDYDFVLQVNSNPIKAPTTDLLRMLIRERTVLYYRGLLKKHATDPKSLDMTQAVIKFINVKPTKAKSPK